MPNYSGLDFWTATVVCGLFGIFLARTREYFTATTIYKVCPLDRFFEFSFVRKWPKD